MKTARDIRPDWFKSLGPGATMELWDKLLDVFTSIQEVSSWMFDNEVVDGKSAPAELIKEGEAHTVHVLLSSLS